MAARVGFTHGTKYAYDFHGCRCADCRAMAAVRRARRRAYMRDYFHEYRLRNLDKLRAYNREWMRRYRAALRDSTGGAAA